MSQELVPILPHGIDPRKVEPGAILLTEPTPAAPRRLVEVVEWDFQLKMLKVTVDAPAGQVIRNLSTSEIRQAQLLRPAPNLIDDYLADTPVSDPPHIAELFERCDEQLAAARAERWGKRRPASVRNKGEHRRGL